MGDYPELVDGVPLEADITAHWIRVFECVLADLITSGDPEVFELILASGWKPQSRRIQFFWSWALRHRDSPCFLEDLLAFLGENKFSGDYVEWLAAYNRLVSLENSTFLDAARWALGWIKALRYKLDFDRRFLSFLQNQAFEPFEVR